MIFITDVWTDGPSVKPQPRNDQFSLFWLSCCEQTETSETPTFWAHKGIKVVWMGHTHTHIVRLLLHASIVLVDGVASRSFANMWASDGSVCPSDFTGHAGHVESCLLVFFGLFIALFFYTCDLLCLFVFLQVSREPTSRGSSGNPANMDQLLGGTEFSVSKCFLAVVFHHQRGERTRGDREREREQ